MSNYGFSLTNDQGNEYIANGEQMYVFYEKVTMTLQTSTLERTAQAQHWLWFDSSPFSPDHIPMAFVSGNAPLATTMCDYTDKHVVTIDAPLSYVGTTVTIYIFQIMPGYSLELHGLFLFDENGKTIYRSEYKPLLIEKVMFDGDTGFTDRSRYAVHAPTYGHYMESGFPAKMYRRYLSTNTSTGRVQEYTVYDGTTLLGSDTKYTDGIMIAIDGNKY